MYRIGIDLGGTTIKAGVVDETYAIRGAAVCDTGVPRPSEEILADMAATARRAVEKAGLTMDQIAGVGVGSPGTCQVETGIVEYANNLGFVQMPMQSTLERLLGKDVRIQNDANAAAFGEYLAGGAKGARSCVCITLGTGVGGGIVLDGRIYSGFNFAGAELGHMVLFIDGEPCTCGRNGCYEAYASATALIRQTRRAMEKHPDSRMWEVAASLEQVDGRTAFDAMRRGDAAARAVVDAYIGYVACGLVNIVNIFQPEVLCIGGGICKEGETLLAPLRRIIERERYSKYSQKQTALRTAQLGNDAGIIGAAFLQQSGSGRPME